MGKIDRDKLAKKAVVLLEACRWWEVVARQVEEHLFCFFF